MKIFLRFYGELNYFLAPKQRKIEITVELRQRSTVKDVIESLGIPHTEVDLVLINHLSASFNQILNDGDRISVYPMFATLDISSVTKLREQPLRKSFPQPFKFIVDVNLGKLALFLRMLGLDVLYHRNLHDDAELALLSNLQHRILLTRDLGLLKRKNVLNGYYIRNHQPSLQILEVLRRFDLLSSTALCSRCLECNTPVVPIKKENVVDQIPPKVAEAYLDFFICPHCHKIYWQGTHFQDMQRKLRHFASKQNI